MEACDPPARYLPPNYHSLCCGAVGAQVQPGRRPAGELDSQATARFTPRFVGDRLETREKARLPLATTGADDTRGAGPPPRPDPKSSRRRSSDSSDHRLFIDSVLHPV